MAREDQKSLMMTESQSRALATIISAWAQPDLWYVVNRGWGANIVLLIVICNTFDNMASPDNLQEWMEISYHPHSSSTKPPPSRGHTPSAAYPSKHIHKRSDGS